MSRKKFMFHWLHFASVRLLPDWLLFHSTWESTECELGFPLCFSHTSEFLITAIDRVWYLRILARFSCVVRCVKSDFTLANLLRQDHLLDPQWIRSLLTLYPFKNSQTTNRFIYVSQLQVFTRKHAACGTSAPFLASKCLQSGGKFKMIRLNLLPKSLKKNGYEPIITKQKSKVSFTSQSAMATVQDLM